MDKENMPIPLERITFLVPANEKVDVRMMAMLTHKSMSIFIRMAIKDKIKQLKEQHQNGAPSNRH